MQSRLKLLGDILCKSNGPPFSRKYQELLPSLSHLPRRLSTDAPSGVASDAVLEAAEPSSDPFLQVSSKGLVYGRLTSIGRSTLKTDILHFFKGCDLSIEDIRVDYNRIYTPVGMILQFSSHSNFSNAQKLIARRGRLYRLEKADRGQWDLLKSYDGKVLLLQGLPRFAIAQDIERFLYGCDYDGSGIQIFLRPGLPEPIKMALVNFPSQIGAMNAFRVKNRGFCVNSPVTVRILQ